MQLEQSLPGCAYYCRASLANVLSGAAGMLSFEPSGEVAGGFTFYGHTLWSSGMLMASIGTDFG